MTPLAYLTFEIHYHMSQKDVPDDQQPHHPKLAQLKKKTNQTFKTTQRLTLKIFELQLRLDMLARKLKDYRSLTYNWEEDV